MLEFELNDWLILKNIFTNINEIIDEIVIECHPEGLKFNALDRSHICFFECNIPKKSFDSYYIDEILFLYVDVGDLVKVLKRGKKKDELVFKADNETIDVIYKNKNTRTFSIIQIDMNDNSREMPKMDYDISYECDFNTMFNSIQDAELYSEVLSFTCKNDLLILNCEGHFGNYQNEILLDENIDGEYTSRYGVNWLLKIFNTKLDSDNLKISMGNDYPMLVEFGSDLIKMNYLLAPRIGSDE